MVAIVLPLEWCNESAEQAIYFSWASGIQYFASR